MMHIHRLDKMLNFSRAYDASRALQPHLIKSSRELRGTSKNTVKREATQGGYENSKELAGIQRNARKPGRTPRNVWETRGNSVTPRET